MKTLPQIKVISLIERQDRRNECMREIKPISDQISTFNFFDAKRVSSDGMVGCSFSHGLCVADLVSSNEDPAFIIFEDDFKILDTEQFLFTVFEALKFLDYWDVFLLGGINHAKISTTPISNCFRVVNSQTCHAYIFNRRYAPKLIEVFFSSAINIAQFSGDDEITKWTARRIFSLDQLWKRNQCNDIFWAKLPFNVVQRESFSDIENANRKYSFGITP